MICGRKNPIRTAQYRYSLICLVTCYSATVLPKALPHSPPCVPRVMPANIPGARKGVRPTKGSSRKASSRTHAFGGGRHKGKSSGGKNANNNKGGNGGVFAVLAAGIVAVVTVVVTAARQNAEYARSTERIRARLRSKPLATSSHAACRMDCRFITEEEVRKTLEEGAFDPKHSSMRAKPCPRVALNLGRVRAVWADCADSTRLVTAIDTVTNHPCPPC